MGPHATHVPSATAISNVDERRSVPVPSPKVWSHVTTHAVIALCAVALLATAVLGSTQPVAASSLSSQISANRSSQLYSESLMRQQDRAIPRIKAQLRITRRALKHAGRDVKRGKAAKVLAKRVLKERNARLARIEAMYEDPSAAPEPWKYKQRLRSIRRDVRIAKARKAAIGKRLRINKRAKRARQYRFNSLKRQRRAAIARRESAEGALAYRIVQMTRLAGARAENQSSVRLSSGGGSFSWPSTGRISQTYGCTGFYLNPRRGSCRHFHDGLDIVAGYGSPVRAAAVGVVAYAGWNPWDQRGRAWIVVVVHPDGYVSRYGHMIPTKRVRVGELVHTGQVIGKMGNTGRSTGTHLHFELLRGGKTVNPFAYLPSGVVKVKIDKTTTKKGKAKAAKKVRQAKKARAAKKAKAARKARAAARAEDDAIDAMSAAFMATAEACQSPVEPAADWVGSYPYDYQSDESTSDAAEGCEAETVGTPVGVSPSASAADPKPGVRSAAPAVPPGVPLPFRGTSPEPR